MKEQVEPEEKVEEDVEPPKFTATPTKVENVTQTVQEVNLPAIEVTVEKVTNSGIVEISFSRAVVFELGGNSTERRMLDEEVYSADDREKLAQAITLEYIPEDDDHDLEKASIASLEVNKATVTSLELKVDYINPRAVSRDAVSAD